MISHVIAGLIFALAVGLRIGLVWAAVSAFICWLFELGDIRETAIVWGQWGLAIGAFLGFIVGVAKVSEAS